MTVVEGVNIQEMGQPGRSAVVFSITNRLCPDGVPARERRPVAWCLPAVFAGSRRGAQ